MKKLPVARTLALALAGFAAASAWPLSLGRAQGLALIGRPLEVGLPVLFEAGDPPPECASAEVFYGDTKVDPGRVSAELVPSATGASVRVRSPVAIDEPVVTVYVNLGCSSRLTRKVVLFAEQPSLRAETAPRAVAAAPVPAPLAVVPAPAPAAVASSTQRAARAPAAERDGASRLPVTPGTRRVTASEPIASRPAAETARPAAKTATSARERAAEARNKAKLKLEPLDLSPAADPHLRQTDALATGEGSSEQRSAAQALWQALNADPQALLRDAQRIAALEKEVADLRAGGTRKDAALAQAQSQLDEAKAERYANPLVYALAVLLLGAIAFAAYAWRRGSFAATEWWRPGDAPDSLLNDLPPHPAPEAPRAAAAEKVAAQHSGAPSAPVDLDFDAVANPDFAAGQTQPMRVAPVPVAAPQEDEPRAYLHSRDFQDSHGVSLRSMKAEELHDVQQEADFFMALGEHERAIEVLRAHIGMNPETSAVAWLDLLGIYHRLGREDEFDYTRGEFERNFNARVPTFAQYDDDEEGGIEDYPNAIGRITALWPSRRVLDVIEDSIFRAPGDDGAPAFSLAAYRDLLMLHHVGEEILGREVAPSSFGDLGGVSQPPGFSATNIHPLSAEGPADGGFDLDFDLGLVSPLDEPLVGLPTVESGDPNMLDFDLPDMDVSSMKTKKTRE